MKVAIVGLGNILFADEGLGTLFVQCLSRNLRNSNDVAIYPLEDRILDLVSLVLNENYSMVIIIDAGNIEHSYIIYRISELSDQDFEELRKIYNTKFSHSLSILDLVLYLKSFKKSNEVDIYLLLFKPKSIKMLDRVNEECIDNLISGFRRLVKILNIQDYFGENWKEVYDCIISSQYLQEAHL